MRLADACSLRQCSTKTESANQFVDLHLRSENYGHACERSYSLAPLAMSMRSLSS